MLENSFRELDDLVLDLKGLVLVRKLRWQNGADPQELAMYSSQIEQARDRLARFAQDDKLVYAA
jgi:hypothetical protein